MSHTVRLDVVGGLPAWRVRVVQPRRFRMVPYTLEPRLFKLPEGALFAVLLQLFDEPTQPYFIHRVLDLSDQEVVRHVSSAGERGRLVIAFDTVGQEAGYDRTLSFDGGLWCRLLKGGQAHNSRVQVRGRAALDAFLGVFLRVSKERGVQAGWDEVERFLL
ncbi:MAG: hypothetical protein HY927_03440 [Elusimicrobia bacterium]|nr:hypothetical protein [Elusimicrobiota bacterium]